MLPFRDEGIGGNRGSERGLNPPLNVLQQPSKNKRRFSSRAGVCVLRWIREAPPVLLGRLVCVSWWEKRGRDPGRAWMQGICWESLAALWAMWRPGKQPDSPRYKNLATATPPHCRRKAKSTLTCTSECTVEMRNSERRGVGTASYVDPSIYRPDESPGAR